MSEKKPERRKTRVPMPEQEPGVRVTNFKEVPLGYTPEQAREEAMRPYVESGSFPTAKQAGVKSRAD